MATLRKADLAGRLSSKMGGTKAAADVALAALVEVLEEALANDNKVVLTGFGTFDVKQMKARKVRPVRGGAAVDVPAHKRVGFSPGASLKAAISRKQ